MPSAWALWLRRGRASDCPSRNSQGTRSLRIYSRRRCHRTEVRAAIRRTLGWSQRGAAARGSRCCHHLCTGRAIGAIGTACRAQGRQRDLRRNPYERYSIAALLPALGRASAPLGRQSDPSRRYGISRAGRREIGIQPQIETLPRSRANEALERLRAGALSGAAVLIP